MHLFPHELYVGEVFFPPMLLDAVLGLAAASLTADFEPFPTVTVLLSSAAGVDRAGHDLHGPIFHLSATGVISMKPIMRIIATSTIVLAALGVIAYKYVDYIEYPRTRDGLVRARR